MILMNVGGGPANIRSCSFVLQTEQTFGKDRS